MSNSKSKIFYKMYARGNYDKICNILFNQDLIFIKDIPISKSDDEEYLVSVAKSSKLYEQDSDNIFIIVKFTENIRTHKRTYEAYLMVFINEQNNYHFIESPEHELRVEVAVHFKPATLDDKIQYLRKCLNDNSINEDNYEDAITRQETENPRKLLNSLSWEEEQFEDVFV